MAGHNVIGLEGEAAALAFLQSKGYTILEKNWRYRKYEIDIIATDGQSLVFVEVKTRSSNHWGNPEDAVSEAKIKRIVDAADWYAQQNNTELPIRFDIISVLRDGKSFVIDHIDDAFLAPLD